MVCGRNPETDEMPSAQVKMFFRRIKKFFQPKKIQQLNKIVWKD